MEQGSPTLERGGSNSKISSVSGTIADRLQQVRLKFIQVELLSPPYDQLNFPLRSNDTFQFYPKFTTLTSTIPSAFSISFKTSFLRRPGNFSPRKYRRLRQLVRHSDS